MTRIMEFDCVLSTPLCFTNRISYCIIIHAVIFSANSVSVHYMLSQSSVVLLLSCTIFNLVLDLHEVLLDVQQVKSEDSLVRNF